MFAASAGRPGEGCPPKLPRQRRLATADEFPQNFLTNLRSSALSARASEAFALSKPTGACEGHTRVVTQRQHDNHEAEHEDAPHLSPPTNRGRRDGAMVHEERTATDMPEKNVVA
jgi:hypothetical protein